MSGSPAPLRPRQGPGVVLGVTEAMIEHLVHRFYGQVRLDPVLGPIFDAAIGDRWDAHLAKLCDFWSSVLLMTGRFKGAPMATHAANGAIRPEHFARWLDLFGQTARESWPAPAADLAAAKAELIGQSLQLGMAVARGELPPMAERLRG